MSDEEQGRWWLVNSQLRGMYKERERVKGDIHNDGYDRDTVSQCEITMSRERDN